MRVIASSGLALVLIGAHAGLHAVPSSYSNYVSVASPAEVALTTNLHRFISMRPRVSEAAMTVYTNTIPGTNVSYRMAPIPGGEFLIGSPASEVGRKPDEGPQRKCGWSHFGWASAK